MATIENMLLDPHVLEVLTKAESTPEGSTVYYKWTCQGCGERVTCDIPNSLYTSFLHVDCGYETLTVEGNLGFLLLIGEGWGEKEDKR